MFFCILINPHKRTCEHELSITGFKVAKLRGQMGWNVYVSIVWEGCVSYKIWQLDNLGIYFDVICHIMRFGPYKLWEFYRRWMYQTHKIIFCMIKNMGEMRENIEMRWLRDRMVKYQENPGKNRELTSITSIYFYLTIYFVPVWLSGRALRQQRKRSWVRFPGNTHTNENV